MLTRRRISLPNECLWLWFNRTSIKEKYEQNNETDMCGVLSQASNSEEDREINRDTHIHRITSDRQQQHENEEEVVNKKRWRERVRSS